MHTESSTINTIAQGSVTVAAVAFLHEALSNMIPYFIVAIPLVLLDLAWGIRAARHRKERVTFSRAFRQTMRKCADYICWIVIAASIALAFETPWLEWAILGAVIANELLSIVTNYLETKGIHLSLVGLTRLLFKAGAGKVGVDISDAETEKIIWKKEEKIEVAKPIIPQPKPKTIEDENE